MAKPRELRAVDEELRERTRGNIGWVKRQIRIKFDKILNFNIARSCRKNSVFERLITFSK